MINITADLDRINDILMALDKLDTKVNGLQFITIKQFTELTGWSTKTVQDLYNRPDFPSCDYGKQKVAEIDAIKDYFKVPRKR